MKRLLAPIAAALVLVSTSCIGGGAEERLLLVDYSSDRYGSFFLYNFPKKVAVHPGTTLVFRQTWTGEPHTVTGGRLPSKLLAKTQPLLEIFVTYDYLRANGAKFPDPENPPQDFTFAEWVAELNKAKPASKRQTLIDAWNALRREGVDIPDLENPPDAPFGESTKAIDELANSAFDELPFVFSEEEEDLTQTVAQPCYLRNAALPANRKPCKKANQKQPAFDGEQNFYNSGVIRYEGQTGNTFRVPLADDIKPGKYSFYCAVHGPLQATEVEVKPAGEDIPSQEAVTREARREIEAVSNPLNEVWSDARDGRIKLGQGDEAETVSGPFAGLFSPKEMHAAIDAFVPERLTVKAGEPIRWKIMGADHTISFDVPRYFPPVQFLKDGTVRLNPKLDPPAGGAPKKPEGDEPPAKIDGGTYDGTGFWSSGLIGPCEECGGSPFLEYTLRISKPGTYKYACLLHPPMVGRVVVT